MITSVATSQKCKQNREKKTKQKTSLTHKTHELPSLEYVNFHGQQEWFSASSYPHSKYSFILKMDSEKTPEWDFEGNWSCVNFLQNQTY